MTQHTIPVKEAYAGEYGKLASAILMQNLHDALHLIVPMHAEAHVRSKMPYVAYQRGNPNSDVTPWVREVYEARHWFLNDAYDAWLNEEASKKDVTGAASFSWCAAQLGKAPDEIRHMALNAIKLAQDAEMLWLPFDLEKVKNRIVQIKRQFDNV